MLTNWLKTIDFVVASLRCEFINLSTKALILIEDCQVPRSNIPSILCLAVQIFLFNLRAGASKYIVSATGHTGQLGCQMYAWGLVDNRLESLRTKSFIEEVKYCQMHSLWRWDSIWIESHPPQSLHSQQMVASASMGTHEVAVVLLQSTRKPIVSFSSGWASDQSIASEWLHQYLHTKNIGIIYKI